MRGHPSERAAGGPRPGRAAGPPAWEARFRSVEQAGLAVGPLGAGVQRRPQAGDEVLGGQGGERGVDRPERLEVVEHGLHDQVRLIFGERGAAHEERLDAEQRDVVGLASAVGAARHGGERVVRELLDQGRELRVGQRDEHGVAGRHDVADRRAADADGVEEAVDAAVAQEVGRLGRAQVLGADVGLAHALRREHRLHGEQHARTGRAERHALAGDVGELVHAGVGEAHEVHRLGVEPDQRSHALEGVALERGLAVVGLVHDVRLRHRQVELVVADRADVEDGAGGRLDGEAQAHPGLVDDAGGGASDRVVHAGDTAGADREERGLGEGEGRERQNGQGGGESFHENPFRAALGAAGPGTAAGTRSPTAGSRRRGWGHGAVWRPNDTRFGRRPWRVPFVRHGADGSEASVDTPSGGPLPSPCHRNVMPPPGRSLTCWARRRVSCARRRR